MNQKGCKRITEITGVKTTADDVKKGLEETNELLGREMTVDEYVEFIRDTYEAFGGEGAGGGAGGNPSTEDLLQLPQNYATSPHKDKWDSTQYGAWADDVWDSHVLPNFFPIQPTSGEMEDLSTTYNSPHSKLMGVRLTVGMMEFEETVERWGLQFYGQESHVEYLKTGLEAKGFCVSEEYSSSYSSGKEELVGLHCFTKDWYVHIRISARYGNDESPCQTHFDITMLEKQFTYPSAFAGIPLPQNAFITGEMWYDVWNATTEEYDYYDFSREPKAGEYWGIYETGFYAISLANYEAYKAQIENAGWTITQTEVPNEYSNRYRFYANKDGVYIIVDYDVEDYCIGFGASNDDNYWG
jgi:hypothetical protein